MLDTAVIEQEKSGVFGEARAKSSGEVALSSRIEALKELTQALSHHVEALVESRSPDLMRRNINLYEEVRRFESDIIRYALMRTGGHQRRAARLLGVKVTTLNAKIKRFKIQLEQDRNLTDEAHHEGEHRVG